MLVAILASLFVTIVFGMCYVFNWRTITKILVPWEKVTSVPITYGTIIPGTIWIFRLLTIFYMMVNAFTDGFYAFIGLRFLIGMGIYELNHMGHLGILFRMRTIDVFIYIYQKWQEPIYVRKHE